jgi:hypothetical protein
MTSRGARWALAAIALTGCAQRVPEVRFLNAPIAWEVDDRHDVPSKPEVHAYYSGVYHLEHGLVYHFTDPMAVRGRTHAENVNALDEVPDSTWFHNRIGVREVSVEEIRWGPDVNADPEPYKPWTISSGKSSGAMPGFLVTDSRGEKFLLKFVPKIQEPEMESASGLIVQRLFWAAGYHVPADTVVHLRSSDLRIAPGAKFKDLQAREQPLTPAVVARVLAQVRADPDGRMRAVASRLLPGEPLGGYSDRGTRAGDPNDLVPHEDRRDLRGQYVFYAWVGHTDIKTDNRLDMWMEDPAHPGRKFVRHYILDFGKSLGVMGATAPDPGDTYAYTFDPPKAALSLLTLGIWRRPGETAEGPGLPGVGRFEAAQFHPGRFRPRRRYLPFDRFELHDAFWATKILMRFTPAHIRAAVEQGELSDPRSEDYLVRTLVARQRKIGAHWLSRTNPLDIGAVSEPKPGELAVCATDLLLRYGLADVLAATHYTARAHEEHGRRLGARRSVRARRDGRVCFEGLPIAGGAEGYTIIELTTVRGADRLPAVWVHVAREPGTRRPRVIGIWRA